MEKREGREFISGFFESVRFCSYQSLEFQRAESSEQILITFLLIFKANYLHSSSKRNNRMGLLPFLYA